MNENKKFQYQMKLNIYKEDISFGPGVARLLELVDKYGNLTQAYNEMQLSSSKGWRIIKNAEEDFGFPLIISTVGGAHGGGSKLSIEGKKLLEDYQDFMDEASKEMDKIFNKYFGN